MAIRPNLTWTDIDTDNLSPDLAIRYTAMNAAKSDFEAAMIDAMRDRRMITDTQSALFTYRRGLAFAIIDKRESKGKVSI